MPTAASAPLRRLDADHVSELTVLAAELLDIHHSASSPALLADLSPPVGA